MTDQSRAAFDKWAMEYCLRDEPNYSKGTEADCLAAHLAGREAMRAEAVKVCESLNETNSKYLNGAYVTVDAAQAIKEIP